MRFIFAILSVFLLQLLSLHLAKGKVPYADKSKRANISVYANKKLIISNKKGKSSLQKISIDDILVLQQTIKKLSFGIYIPFKRFDYKTDSTPFVKQLYSSFLFSTYSYIFNFLFPKHVFW